MIVENELQYELYKRLLTFIITSSNSVAEIRSKIKENNLDAEMKLTCENMFPTLAIKLFDYEYYVHGSHIELLWQKQELEQMI